MDKMAENLDGKNQNSNQQAIELEPKQEQEVDQETSLVEEGEAQPEDTAQIAVEAETDQEGEEDLSFGELYESSFKPPKEGELLAGIVVQINKENVMVDIGYKSDGRIPIEEFTDQNGNVNINVGDEIEVILERHDGEVDDILLSKEKAARIKVWEAISKTYNDDGVIKGKIVARVKGGLAVDVGVTAFLPGSQVDLRPIKDLEALVGQTFPFKILKYNKRRENVVLSRRALMEEERQELKSETISLIEEGKVLEGVIKNITDYGAFVDLGGIDGLLHITDLSWGRINHPSEVLKVGEKIKVVILSFDKENERVSLGLKQLQEDPWIQAGEAYPVGSKITGKVVSLTDYGAFVEIQEGIEGLIHVSEMSWTRKIRNPSKVLSVGDIVECMVLSIDSGNKRISLGMKQVEPNPWDIVAEQYQAGTIIEGKIKSITDFGLFIGIAEGIDGLVHVSDISWTKRVKHPGELYKKGDEIQAVVLKVDKGNERFSLGIKQLETDPWELIPSKYPANSRVTGTVTNVTDFGLFIELEEGIEGLVHISEVERIKGKSLKELYSLGDVISAKVINISVGDRKIGLSIKRLKKEEERSYLKSYSNSATASTSSLGEQLQQALNRVNLQNDLEERAAAEAEADESESAEESLVSEGEEEPEIEEASSGEPVEAEAADDESSSTEEPEPEEVLSDESVSAEETPIVEDQEPAVEELSAEDTAVEEDTEDEAAGEDEPPIAVEAEMDEEKA